MNELMPLAHYSATNTPHLRAGSPYHRDTTAGGRRGRRRSARHSVASGLHRLAERLDA